jgi:tetratricopeptide (TPR) repeat protein
MMKRIVVLLVAAFLAFPAAAQQKFALVIGNADYRTVTKLKNPLNDAADMKRALESLGFNVNMVNNGSLKRMTDAVAALKAQLRASPGSYGFLFYSGHGVQSQGQNYLIPADATIESETDLPRRALSLQNALDELNAAANEVNVVVLDSCRDNPFDWSSSAKKGLTVITHRPNGSIIVYATGEGMSAIDGTGRNGVFTGSFIKHLTEPGLEIMQVFKKTGEEVEKETSGKQHPAVYTQYYKDVYLGSKPAPGPVPTPAPSPGVDPTTAHDYIKRGNFYFEQGNYEAAFADYSEAIKLEPGNSYAWAVRGYCQVFRGETEAAFIDLNHAVKLDPRNAYAFSYRSALYVSLGNANQAFVDSNRAILLEPNRGFHYYLRGSAWQTKGDGRRAKADLDRAENLGYGFLY